MSELTPFSYNYTIYRQAKDSTVLSFFDTSDAPIDVTATYDDILFEVRKAKNPESKRLMTRQLTEGTIQVANTNEVIIDLTSDIEGGNYYYDIFAKLAGTEDWIILYGGRFINTNNVSNTL